MKLIFAALLILSGPAIAGSKFRNLFEAEVAKALEQSKQRTYVPMIQADLSEDIALQRQQDRAMQAMETRILNMEFQRQIAEQRQQMNQREQQRLETQRKMDQWQRDVQQKNRQSQQRINQQVRDR